MRPGFLHPDYFVQGTNVHAATVATKTERVSEFHRRTIKIKRRSASLVSRLISSSPPIGQPQETRCKSENWFGGEIRQRDPGGLFLFPRPPGEG